jgi:5-methylcytosine-specific restriction protein A
MEDGRFAYTGEGQVGDMEFIRGNKAIRDHVANLKHLLLFEQTRPGYCRFQGEYVYIGHHLETRPDREGKPRSAIVFELARINLDEIDDLALSDDDQLVSKPNIPAATSLTVLRQLAQTGSGAGIAPRTVQTNLYVRSVAVKRYALARARVNCECCDAAAPFLTKKGEPYLEVHHLFRVADGGPDTPEGVAAICPTCHRRIHVGADGAVINDALIRKVEKKERML